MTSSRVNGDLWVAFRDVFAGATFTDLLIEERGVAAIGHEPLDTDPGIVWSRGDVDSERYVQEHDRWQIEGVAALDRVPERGALIMASWPKPKAGSGFPARAVAIHRA